MGWKRSPGSMAWPSAQPRDASFQQEAALHESDRHYAGLGGSDDFRCADLLTGSERPDLNWRRQHHFDWCPRLQFGRPKKHAGLAQIDDLRVKPVIVIHP